MSPDKEPRLSNNSEDVSDPLAGDTEDGVEKAIIKSDNASDEKQQKSDSESSSDEEKTFRKQCENLGDPMAEDFEHPVVNSYKFNNFDIEQEPGYLNRVKALGIPTGTKVYSLNVKHIHQGFNQRGMENIFRQFGEIIECRLARLRQDAPATEKTWATVKFAAKMEAANAIAALNGKPPFNFSVTWSKSKDLKERQKKEAIREKLYSTKFTELMKEDEKTKAAEFDWPKTADTFEKINNELLKKLRDEAKCDTNENSENSDSETNEYTSRKRGDRGDRRIHNAYEFNPSVDTQPREFGRPLYTSASVGSACCRCNSAGRMTCSSCCAWYCSLACQEIHWPTHRTNCTLSQPRLDRRLSEVSLDEIEKETEEISGCDDQGSKSDPLLARQEVCEDTNLVINGVEEAIDQPSSKLEVTETSNDLADAGTHQEDTDDNTTDNPVEDEGQLEKENLSMYTLYSPRVGESFHGTVSHVVSPHELYILPDCSKDLYDEVLVDIQEEPHGEVTPQPGELCLASYQGVWFRSTLLQIFPSGNVQVFFIDFGMTTEVDENNIKPLVKYREHGGFVIKIKTHGIEPSGAGWGDDTIDQFREIVDECGNTKFKVTIIEKNISGVLIAKLEDGEDNDVSQLCIEYAIAIDANSKNIETEMAKLNLNAYGSNEGEPESVIHTNDEIANKKSDADADDPKNDEIVNKKSDADDPATSSSPRVILSPVKSSLIDSKPPPCAQSFLTTLAKGDKIQMAKDQWAPFSQFGAQICKGVLEDDEDGNYLYEDLQDEAEDYRSNGSTSRSPRLKSWVVAWSQEDQFFFRAVIIEMTPPDKFTTFLIDFGYIQTFKRADLIDMWPQAQRCAARGVHVLSGCIKGKRVKLEDSLKEMGQAFFKDKEEDTGKYVEGDVVAVRSEGVYLRFPGLEVIFMATPWYNCNGKAKALFNMKVK